MCRVIVRCRAITRATTRSSDFSNTLALCGGIFAIEVHHVLAEEDVVVVLVTVKAERNGRPAAFPEVHVWRLANEKITEFREFQGDEQTEDRFWS
jgi:uncharacterized protein